ncbi:MAG: hypothetical protein Q606_CBAC00011G0002, partial [Intestinibacter bartlettii DORA_8_9]
MDQKCKMKLKERSLNDYKNSC